MGPSPFQLPYAGSATAEKSPKIFFHHLDHHREAHGCYSISVSQAFCVVGIEKVLVDIANIIKLLNINQNTLANTAYSSNCLLGTT